jgi:hypothetical protein
MRMKKWKMSLNPRSKSMRTDRSTGR